MPYIQIFDEKKECWVLKKVKEIPKVEEAVPRAPQGWAMNIPYTYTFDEEVMRRLNQLGHRVENIRVTTTTNTANTTTAPRPAPAPQVDRYFVDTFPVERVTVEPAPQPVYYPGSGELPNYDEPRENQHVRRVREFRNALRRTR